jgi:hypothetical protein
MLREGPQRFSRSWHFLREQPTASPEVPKGGVRKTSLWVRYGLRHGPYTVWVMVWLAFLIVDGEEGGVGKGSSGSARADRQIRCVLRLSDLCAVTIRNVDMFVLQPLLYHILSLLRRPFFGQPPDARPPVHPTHHLRSSSPVPQKTIEMMLIQDILAEQREGAGTDLARPCHKRACPYGYCRNTSGR